MDNLSDLAGLLKHSLHGSSFERSLRPERFKKFDTWYMNYKKKTLRLPCFEDVWEAVKYFKVKDKFW